MCTLAVAVQHHEDFPLVVAANRDEALMRPAQDWAPRNTAAGTPMVSPLDLTAGGTWMGINRHGLVVALTNHHSGTPPDATRLSRGELVDRALNATDVQAACAALQPRNAALYNPFHLVVADRCSAWLWMWDGAHADWAPLPPGLHVITEQDGRGMDARGKLLREQWPATPDVPALWKLLSIHAAPPRSGTCLHLEPVYGTRSCAVLRVGVRELTLHSADGPPCLNPPLDRTQLLRGLEI